VGSGIEHVDQRRLCNHTSTVSIPAPRDISPSFPNLSYRGRETGGVGDSELGVLHGRHRPLERPAGRVAGPAPDATFRIPLSCMRQRLLVSYREYS
jgi:hypothetical protein